MSERKVLIGNSLDVLKQLDAESVDVCVTSPPYWGLRDYGTNPQIWGGQTDCQHEWDANNHCIHCHAWKGQLGLEPNPLDYIEHLCLIFDEVKRVLKPTGACWVNLGDTYATVSGSGLIDKKARSLVNESMDNVAILRKGLKTFNFKEKSLCQIPSRFAISMTDRGWILRNEVIWQKPNAMPISTKDRFTVDFEKFFFFTKNPKYYFKQQYEPLANGTIARAKRAKHNTLDHHEVVRGTNAYDVQHNDPDWQRWAKPEGRNKRAVWNIPLKGSHESHIAMYPLDLIDTPIKSCCPKNGVVLDPFCGSGTTLQYCMEHDINAIGIELNPEYEEIIRRKAKTNIKTLEEGGKEKE